MENLWNNTCVLITDDGNVILSESNMGRHNEAISECSSKIGLMIDENQSMVDMLEKLVKNNHIILLNCGKISVNDCVMRTGYLALPEKFTSKQLEKVEKLCLLLNEYQSLTVWHFENNKLKTKSMGNSENALIIIQNMIDELSKDSEIKR